MPTRSIRFPGATGELLSARLEIPANGHARAWALFAHCFTCSKNLHAAVHVTRELAQQGYGVLRFDFTGLGESEGDFADTNFSSNVEDVVAAARFMAEEEDMGSPSLLVGHSLGGAAVLAAAPHVKGLRAVATLGAPAEPAHVLEHVDEAREEIERAGVATVRLGGRPFSIRKQFLEDVSKANLKPALEGLHAAVLFMHSPVDRTVGIGNAAALYEMARHPKSFISLDDADHLLSRESDARYAARVLATWASRYVDESVAPADFDELIAADRVISRTGREGYRTDIRAGTHSLLADEPESVGGEDLGPTPYDLVLSGLGACTSMTLQMYARRKGWPLDEARVRLRHEKVHKRDREASEGGGDGARLDHVMRDVQLRGDLDAEQRARLMEIADRCPVHRTLDAGVRITTRETTWER